MASFTDYYQLTKPGIVRANVLTAAAGFLFASKGHVNLGLLVAVLIGTALVIASGCIFNNYLDRTIDRKMKRTQKRALVTGGIRFKTALILASVFGVAGFIVLGLFTNRLVVITGLIALFGYVVAYGYVKRRSPLGTEVGTIPGAASIVAGYLTVTNRLDITALLLFLIMVFWQLPHFYSIALFRAKEYAAAKLPVLPLVKGEATTKRRILIYIVIFTIITSLLHLESYASKTYAVVMVIAGFSWLLLGIKGLTATDTIKWAHKMFGWSLLVLLVFIFMLTIDTALP